MASCLWPAAIRGAAVMAYKYTYIVECRTPAVHMNEREAYNGDIWHVTYYVGGTNNPRQRIEAHLAGKGAKYLKGREILRVAISPQGRGELEYQIKHGYTIDGIHIPRWSREEKQEAVDLAFLGPSVSSTIWRPFWHRCETFHHPSGHGSECVHCKGTGGVFD